MGHITCFMCCQLATVTGLVDCVDARWYSSSSCCLAGFCSALAKINYFAAAQYKQDVWEILAFQTRRCHGIAHRMQYASAIRLVLVLAQATMQWPTGGNNIFGPCCATSWLSGKVVLHSTSGTCIVAEMYASPLGRRGAVLLSAAHGL